MARDATIVLTYHSIGDEPGPTSMTASQFAAQMRGLADAGYDILTLAGFAAWRGGEGGSARRALITFDDGFLDFQTLAHPVLREHGFSSVVFVPTGKLGGVEDWDMGSRRALMSWPQVEALAAEGVEFGAHGVGHRDLTRLEPEARRFEIAQSSTELARRLRAPVAAFAAPYGHTNAAALAEIAERYELGFGTRLGLARRDDPRFDIPRVEMHYFRDAQLWRAFLDGAHGYFNGRKALRAVREGVGGVLRTIGLH